MEACSIDSFEKGANADCNLGIALASSGNSTLGLNNIL